MVPEQGKPLAQEGIMVTYEVNGHTIHAETGCHETIGHWACPTCDKHFPNNLMATSHEDDTKHVLYWFCHEHDRYETN